MDSGIKEAKIETLCSLFKDGDENPINQSDEEFHRSSLEPVIPQAETVKIAGSGYEFFACMVLFAVLNLCCVMYTC